MLEKTDGHFLKQGFRTFVFVLLIAATISQLACLDKSAALDVATAGSATGSALTTFYQSLIDDTNQTWDMDVFWSALYDPNLKVPVEPASNSQDQEKNEPTVEGKIYQERIIALKSRVKMSKALSKLYTSLRDLSSYDAPGQVQDSAEKLGNSLNALIPFPGGVNPSTIVSHVASDLVGLKQSKDIRKSSKIILDLVTQLKTLFDAEKRAYLSISRDRVLTTAAIGKYFIKNKMVIAWPMLQGVPESLGLAWASDVYKKPVEDPRTVDAFVALLRQRAMRVMDVTDSAANSLGDSLEELLDAQAKFLADKPITLDQLKAALTRAQSYVEEANELKVQYKKAKEKSDD